MDFISESVKRDPEKVEVGRRIVREGATLRIHVDGKSPGCSKSKHVRPPF